MDPDISSRRLERFRFLAPRSLTTILAQVQIVGILAVAQSLIVLTAGIDLSVGAIMIFSSVIMGQFTFRYGLPPEFAIICGLAFGTAVGFVNGILVALVRLPPFIVTLGMWQIVASANFLYSRNETIRGRDIEEQAPVLQFFGGEFNFGDARFTYGVIFMLLLVALFAYILRHTAWGRHVYAVGDDPDAAELAGVKTKRTLISVYTVAGFICGLAGWAFIARSGAVSPSAGQDANIEAITAVVIGGISLFGGRGSILGPLFGALIVGRLFLCAAANGAEPTGHTAFHWRSDHHRRSHRPMDPEAVRMTEPILQARGLVKRYRSCDRAGSLRFRSAAGRDPGGDRRQWRWQIDADQGDFGRCAGR